MDPSHYHSAGWEPHHEYHGDINKSESHAHYPRGHDPEHRHHAHASDIRPKGHRHHLTNNDDDGKPNSFGKVFSRFAERTSMTGLPYIYSSRRWYAKFLWTFLFFVGFCAMVIHLIYLIYIFTEYETTTSVSLGFSKLAFPAVTVCNVNAVRKSQLALVSRELGKLVNDVTPSKVVQGIKQKQQRQVGGRGAGSVAASSVSGVNPLSGRGKRRKREVVSQQKSASHYLEGFEVEETNKRYKKRENDDDDDSEYTGNKSVTRSIEDEFKYLFSTMPRETRETVGHQIEGMLMECTFGGIECQTDQFRLRQTAEYGNCYTIEEKRFISSIGGPNDGLTLIFFLEDDEYLDGITSSLGFQVHVHAPGAWPNPYEEGLSVAAGTETFIGLKQINIKREKDPYGDCVDGDEFRELYKVVYTQKTCQVFCLQKEVVSRCGCFDPEDEPIYRKLYPARRDISFCGSDDETDCLLNVLDQHQSGILNCDCPSPCSETVYSKQLSSHVWPTKTYSSILVEYLCDINETLCAEYETKNRNDISTSFLKMIIYFEDLNYENITEQPDYEVFQFASDIGGTIGLWIGLSIISVFEVVQFLYEFLAAACSSKKRSVQKERSQTSQLRASRPSIRSPSGSSHRGHSAPGYLHADHMTNPYIQNGGGEIGGQALHRGFHGSSNQGFRPQLYDDKFHDIEKS